MYRGKVVVGVDGSSAAGEALVWAAEEASRRHLTLEIAYSNAGDHDVPDRILERHPDFARSLVLDAQSTVYDSSATCGVSTVLSGERPEPMLIALSAEAELVVVGSHGLGQIAAVALGSVTFRVAAYAHCPVVIVPGNWARHFSPTDAPIVVGVSSTESGLNALNFAFAEADRLSLPLVAVRSWSDLDWARTSWDAAPAASTDSIGSRADYTSHLLGPLRERFPNVDVRPIQSDLAVEAGLLGASEHAALLVLGRGAGIAHPGRLSQTTSHLAHKAKCPVAIAGTPSSLGSELLDAQLTTQ
ncbi:MAG: universal stress protein [Pseudonocardiales bacterium]|nr:universal stress protein [Pseudonocardiales bacterium]